jgi:hypothetical protein
MRLKKEVYIMQFEYRIHTQICRRIGKEAKKNIMDTESMLNKLNKKN